MRCSYDYFCSINQLYAHIEIYTHGIYIIFKCIHVMYIHILYIQIKINVYSEEHQHNYFVS